MSKKMTRNCRKLIEQMGNSLLLSKHSIQLLALFLLLSVCTYLGSEKIKEDASMWNSVALKRFSEKCICYPQSLYTRIRTPNKGSFQIDLKLLGQYGQIGRISCNEHKVYLVVHTTVFPHIRPAGVIRTGVLIEGWYYYFRIS